MAKKNYKKSPPKDKFFTFRVSEKLIEEYKTICWDHSINISDRFRKFIMQELKNFKKMNENKDKDNG